MGAKFYDCYWDTTKWYFKTGSLLIQVITRTGFTVKGIDHCGKGLAAKETITYVGNPIQDTLCGS